jgi:hypothetical protein
MPASPVPPPSPSPSPDGRLLWPAPERNKGPITEVLQRVLPARGRLLEVASGSGQHAAHASGLLDGWTWQPTDPDAAMRASIAAWTAQVRHPNLLPVRALDLLTEPDAPPAAEDPLAGPFDALFNANMVHISPWATCGALMRLAARRLTAQGVLVVYGPFLVDGEPTSPGNLAFDADLRQRDPHWGLRTLGAVCAEAGRAGWRLDERIAMPAHNLTLVFRRVAA